LALNNLWAPVLASVGSTTLREQLLWQAPENLLLPVSVVTNGIRRFAELQNL